MILENELDDFSGDKNMNLKVATHSIVKNFILAHALEFIENSCFMVYL